MSITTCLICACVALFIFVAYNVAAIIQFGELSSLSNTYYYYENKKKGLGWLFRIMMYIMSFTLLPAALELSDAVSSWSHYCTFLIFIGIAAIAFVGTAPDFRSSKLESAVHMSSAGIAAAACLLWCAIVCWKIMYIIPIWLVLCWGLAFATKTNKSMRDWWWEMVAFGATYTTIIVQCILLL